MLRDEIKRRITEAMKAKREVEKEILRVALGELQAVENRSNAPLPEEEAHKIIRKLIKSNGETLAAAGAGSPRSAEIKAKLEEEIRILEGLLPARWDADRIGAALAPNAEEIRAAKSDGQATGVAMKALKALGASVEGKDVAEAVKRIRTPSG